MSKQLGVTQYIVDAGVASDVPAHPDLRVVKIGRGTGDISQGPAMTREQAEEAVLAGITLAIEAANSGADLIATGDMGIGNTTSSSAIAAASTQYHAQLSAQSKPSKQLILRLQYRHWLANQSIIPPQSGQPWSRKRNSFRMVRHPPEKALWTIPTWVHCSIPPTANLCRHDRGQRQPGKTARPR